VYETYQDRLELLEADPDVRVVVLHGADDRSC
jgi:hypothetical protein